jgi:hypothetical protein
VEGLQKTTIHSNFTHPPVQLDTDKPPCKPFIVKVDDNYHYMDEDSRYTAGEFDTYEEALALAKKIVDETTYPSIESGHTPDEVVYDYKTFGEDPWIVSDGSIPYEGSFSAWSYAKKRATELSEPKHKKLENDK